MYLRALWLLRPFDFDKTSLEAAIGSRCVVAHRCSRFTARARRFTSDDDLILQNRGIAEQNNKWRRLFAPEGGVGSHSKGSHDCIEFHELAKIERAWPIAAKSDLDRDDFDPKLVEFDLLLSSVASVGSVLANVGRSWSDFGAKLAKSGQQRSNLGQHW